MFKNKKCNVFNNLGAKKKITFKSFEGQKSRVMQTLETNNILT